MAPQEFEDRTTRERLVEEVSAGMAELQAAIDAADQAVADHLGVNRTDLRSLELLVRHGPMTAGRLATELGLTPGSVTTLIDRLERAGYAERERDRRNRSRVYVTPSNRLWATAGELLGERGEQARRPGGTQTAGQLALVRDFLRRARTDQVAFAARVRSLPPLRHT
jgi:DNA-binding MarR family transcriptional regulator